VASKPLTSTFKILLTHLWIHLIRSIFQCNSWSYSRGGRSHCKYYIWNHCCRFFCWV